MKRIRCNSIVAFAIVAALRAMAGDVPKAPVPQSPFVKVVYAYADAMLKNGRDNYGPQKTGLFLSALDRTTMAPLANVPPAPPGVRAAERVGGANGPLVGANLQHDENLLRLLYSLSELTTKPFYRAAADSELKWFIENSQSRTHDFVRSEWDVLRDGTIPARGDSSAREFVRPWILWDRCFEVSPVSTANLFLASNQNDAGQTPISPRELGFNIRTLAVAYAKTKDAQLLRQIETLLTRFEKQSDAASILSLAIDCDGAAHRVPEPLASRLRSFAARQDEQFWSLPHNLKERSGFVFELHRNSVVTPLWTPGRKTTAQIGMMCVSRYDNSGKVPYRDLILAAANVYLNSLPGDGEDVWPMTFGHAISLELAAWRHSAEARYMERARKVGEIAVAKFFGTNALPRASLKSEHYEAITGGDTLALALLELHLNILHITAVRCPPNTIDR